MHLGYILGHPDLELTCKVCAYTDVVAIEQTHLDEAQALPQGQNTCVRA